MEHDNRDVVAWWFEKIDYAISQSKGMMFHLDRKGAFVEKFAEE